MLGGTASWLGLTLYFAMAATGCTNTEPPSTPGKLALQRSCDGTAQGFADPALAYGTYAKAVNDHAWCRAASTYTSEARPKLASLTFKGLALTAGSRNHPKHAAYSERFQELCAKYQLDCDTAERASELSESLLHGKSNVRIDARLAELGKSMPEDVYGDAMSILAQVDPNAIRALDPQLHDLAQQEDRATGVAKLLDGRSNPMLFRKLASGWLLDLR